LSLWRLAQATQESIPPGETWSYRRRLLITPHNDVASATDVIFPLVGFADGRSGIRGRVEPRERPVAVHVRLAEKGAPVTQILTRTRGPAAGEFHAVLPPGDYVLEFHSAHEPVREVPVKVESGIFAQVPTQRLGDPGWLILDPAFADGGAGRVIVTGLGETPDPIFRPELLDFRVDDVRASSGSATRDLIFTGGPDDSHRVALAPGHYRLTATRGPEYDIAQREIRLGAGDEVRVDGFDLRRVADLSAFTAADLHVHAQASDDSAVPNAEVLRRMLAEGIQVLVSSDHENLGDFGPALDALGVRDRIRVIGGAEVTSSAPSPAAPWTIGHSNTWPVAYRENAHRNGAPPSQDLGLADLYSLLRREHDVRVVQLNHPRDVERGEIDRGAFFTHLATAGVGFDPDRPIAEGSNALLLEVGSDGETRPIDFDAVELMNGSSWEQYLQVRRDWYSLLSQGFRRTATANSDTHGPDEVAGYPRNYVAVDFRDDPARFDRAVREGRLFGSNGPLIASFSVNGARAGDTVEAPEGRANVQFAIVAAPWVPVDEVRLLVNGRVVSRYPLDPHDPHPLRLLEQLELQLDGDAFVILEAGAPVDADTASWVASHPGPYTEAVAPGFVATAFSNPVFVDVDGNGRFDAPGLGTLPGPPPDRALGWMWLAAVWVALVTVLWLRRLARARARAA
jgi:hypothetical protein